jgi:predicted DNA-binding transcriptional regulator AlpA
MDMGYSTAEVAQAIGVSKKTLLRWLWAKKLKDPRRVTIGSIDSRDWGSADLERARAYKEQNYRKRP